MTGWLGRRLQERRIASMADPAAGTLQVTAASYPPTEGSVRYSNYRLIGVVSAPGLPPTAVQQRGVARVSRWPRPGTVLPVTVDRTQPDRFVIAWDQVPNAADQALADARNLALHQQTNLDFAVMNDAIDRAGEAPEDPHPAAATAAATAASPAQDPPPPLVAPGPAIGPAADQPPPPAVPGSVVAVYPVPAPAALAPPGGVWDLSVRTADRTVLVRASFGSEEARARVARVGAAVTVAMSEAADVATLVTTDGT